MPGGIMMGGPPPGLMQMMMQDIMKDMAGGGAPRGGTVRITQSMGPDGTMRVT